MSIPFGVPFFKRSVVGPLGVDAFGDGSGIALYKLDGNALDSGGLYNGTASNVTYGAGKFGQTSVFNGTNSLITTEIPHSALAISTFSVWVNPTNSANFRGVFGDHNGSGYKGIIGFQFNNGIASFGYGKGSGWVGSDVSVPLNTWTHLVGMITGSGLKIYKNGVLVISVTGTALVPNGNLYIGRAFTPGAERYWKGSIDQFRIFNKALTQAEVTALYNEVG